MPNSYFEFKQFTIQQDRCAMKVTTDGCLFGAVAAKEISALGSVDILDVGAGTGLLSLMVAQQNKDCLIDAIEIDDEATNQAAENVAASPWSNQVNVLHVDLLNYQPGKLYDVIISNPPFYENQLKSPKAGRQLAHHSAGLTLEQLFQQAKKLLTPEGKFFVLLPFYRTNEAVIIARQFELFPEKKWLVKQTHEHDFFRSIFCFNKQNVPGCEPSTICIEEQLNVYSTAFTDLLKPYYLKL